MHTAHQEIVNKLLAKLLESERTVMTLFYLGEMTTKEIGKFLGTVTSRLQRARKRLQQDEELLVQGMLGSVQLPGSPLSTWMGRDEERHHLAGMKFPGMPAGFERCRLRETLC